MHWTHNQSTHHWLITTSDCLTKQAWTHIAAAAAAAAAAASTDSPYLVCFLSASLSSSTHPPFPLNFLWFSLSSQCLNTFHMSLLTSFVLHS